MYIIRHFEKRTIDPECHEHVSLQIFRYNNSCVCIRWINVHQHKHGARYSYPNSSLNREWRYSTAVLSKIHHLRQNQRRLATPCKGTTLHMDPALLLRLFKCSNRATPQKGSCFGRNKTTGKLNGACCSLAAINGASKCSSSRFRFVFLSRCFFVKNNQPYSAVKLRHCSTLIVLLSCPSRRGKSRKV